MYGFKTFYTTSLSFDSIHSINCTNKPQRNYAYDQFIMKLRRLLYVGYNSLQSVNCKKFIRNRYTLLSPSLICLIDNPNLCMGFKTFYTTSLSFNSIHSSNNCTNKPQCNSITHHEFSQSLRYNHVVISILVQLKQSSTCWWENIDYQIRSIYG